MELVPEPLERIPPGTVIATGPPEGWTHLVIKSVPRLEAAEREKVPGIVSRLATSFTTSIVARTAADPRQAQGGRVIEAVAIGLSTPIAGRDVVVNADQADKLGANLGIIGNLVLGQADNRLNQVVTRIRSPRLVVFDVPGLLVAAEVHRDVLLRYALVMDSAAGELTSWVWVMEMTPEGSLRLDPLRCRFLAPSTVEQCRMHVDPGAILAGVPGSRAFAVVEWPPGTELRLGQGFRRWLTPAYYDENAAAELLRQLQGLRVQVPSGEGSASRTPRAARR